MLLILLMFAGYLVFLALYLIGLQVVHFLIRRLHLTVIALSLKSLQHLLKKIIDQNYSHLIVILFRVDRQILSYSFDSNSWRFALQLSDSNAFDLVQKVHLIEVCLDTYICSIYITSKNQEATIRDNDRVLKADYPGYRSLIGDSW